MLVISHLNSRNTCTQEPLARLPNSFSVITVILLINMPIPFKFDSCIKKTQIPPHFSTDFSVFDTVAKKPFSFLDISHKTNRRCQS